MASPDESELIGSEEDFGRHDHELLGSEDDFGRHEDDGETLECEDCGVSVGDVGQVTASCEECMSAWLDRNS